MSDLVFHHITYWLPQWLWKCRTWFALQRIEIGTGGSTPSLTTSVLRCFLGGGWMSVVSFCFAMYLPLDSLSNLQWNSGFHKVVLQINLSVICLTALCVSVEDTVLCSYSKLQVTSFISLSFFFFTMWKILAVQQNKFFIASPFHPQYIFRNAIWSLMIFTASKF